MKVEKFLGLAGIICLIFLGVPIRISENFSDEKISFEKFILKFNKTYNDTEYKTRFKNFKASIKKIAELNKNRTDNNTALYGLTEYSDLSQDEFIEKKLQKSIKQFHHKHSRHRNEMKERVKRESLPQRVDWREKGVVGMVYNQKSCGACWAFATIETVESMNAIRTGAFVDLSVQQVIDCARYGNYGCEGGNPCALLTWLVSTKTKITTQKLYPFIYKTGSCKGSALKTGIQIKSFTCEDLAGAEDELVKDLAYHGPVAAVVNAINWQYYLGGIIQFHCSNGVNDMNHAVQIVGYDKTGPVPYYIAKNSWGPEFGNKGYVYIAMGKNLCGLANQILGIVVFALCIWLHADEAFYRWVKDLQIYEFYSGIYIILFGSCVIILTSCLSCLFIANENINGMKIMIIVYLVEYLCGLIGAALLLNYSTRNSAIEPLIRNSMLSLIAQSQNDTRAYTLKLIQESIGCCGADGANDYLESRKALPSECRDSVTGHTYFHGCVDELTWFLEEKAIWLSGAAMFLCFFDVLKAVFTWVLIKAIREADKGSY